MGRATLFRRKQLRERGRLTVKVILFRKATKQTQITKENHSSGNVRQHAGSESQRQFAFARRTARLLDVQMFSIGRHNFDIAHTEFRAHVSIGESGWSTSGRVEVVAQPRAVNEMAWAPKLRSHTGLSGLPHPLKLAETKLGPLQNDEWDEPAFLLYNFEHNPIEDPVLLFKDRGGPGFLFEFRGMVANFIDEAAADLVPVIVECRLRFDGAFVDEFRVEPARRRLEQVFGSSGWFAPIRHDNLAL